MLDKLNWSEFFSVIKYITKIILIKLNNLPIKLKYKKKKFNYLLT